MPYCTKCGNEVTKDMVYCPKCGNRLVISRDEAVDDKAIEYSPRPEEGQFKNLRPVSIRGHSEWVTWAFVALIIMTLVIIWAYFRQADLITDAINGRMITFWEAEENDARIQQFSFIWLGVYILATVLFLVWIYRAHKNLSYLGATDLRFTPGWAVGWFFIPIMNLFRPYQVVSEIWKASDSEINTKDSFLWKRQPTSPIVGLWWAAFLIINYFDWFVTWRIDTSTYDLTELLNITYLYIASDFVTVIGIIITITMVRMTSRRQES